MSVLSEEKLCKYLERTLDLSRAALERIPNEGTDPIPSELHDQYVELVNALIVEKENDPHLGEDGWNWIWQNKPEFNAIQLYGRLAWINLQLLELL